MPDVTLDLGNQYIGSAYSPQVAITDTEDGHEVTFTFADSEHPGQLTTASYDVPTYADEEAAREAAEAARQAYEAQRRAAEDARKAAETSRAGAESSRVGAEQARESAEQGRQYAEAARQQAEAARAAAETARAGAESTRQSAEQARKDAESARQFAEHDRRAAEELRDEAEQARESAEAAREAAEQARETDTAAAIAGAQVATSAANTAASAANTAATAAEGATSEAETATDAANAAAALATAASASITDAYFPDLTAGAAEGITGGGPTDTAAWLQRTCPGTDGPATIESIHGNTIVQDGELLSVNMTGIESADANDNVLTSRTIPAATYFPNGMRSAGTVYDELTSDAAVTRVGSIHIDAVTDSTEASGVTIGTVELPNGLDNVTPDLVSCVCDKLETYQTTNTLFVQRTNVVKVSRLTSSNTAMRAFILFDGTQTMSGINDRLAEIGGIDLHYPITPTTTPIDPPLNLTYRVSDFGTERILHTDPTAAPTLVVTYGSTADGIRDRALACIAPVENGKASANYGVGSYLIHAGQLCRVTTAIAAGEAITIGTNVVATTVMAEVIALTQ